MILKRKKRRRRTTSPLDSLLGPPSCFPNTGHHHHRPPSLPLWCTADVSHELIQLPSPKKESLTSSWPSLLRSPQQISQSTFYKTPPFIPYKCFPYSCLMILPANFLLTFFEQIQATIPAPLKVGSFPIFAFLLRGSAPFSWNLRSLWAPQLILWGWPSFLNHFTPQWLYQVIIRIKWDSPYKVLWIEPGTL